MFRSALSALALFGLSLLPGSAAAATFVVTTNADSGPGSLRDALEDTTPGSRKIVIQDGVGTITALSTLTYDLPDPLTIIGRGERKAIEADFGSADLFLVNGGADLELVNLTFRGSLDDNIRVVAPDTRTGTIEVKLTDVMVEAARAGGLVISDSFGPASIEVDLIRSQFRDNEVNINVSESGAGDVFFGAVEVLSEAAEGGNAIVLERSEGSVFVEVIRSAFNDSETDFGFQALEQDSGDLIAVIVDSEFNRNDVISGTSDAGLRLVERAGGSLEADLTQVTANGNAGEGIRTTESDAGDIQLSLRRVTTDGNGVGSSSESGVQVFSDDDPGTVEVEALGLRSRDNTLHGLDVEGPEGVEVEVISSTLTDNGVFGISAFSDIAAGRLRVLRTDLSGNGSGEIDTNLP